MLHEVRQGLLRGAEPSLGLTEFGAQLAGLGTARVGSGLGLCGDPADLGVVSGHRRGDDAHHEGHDAADDAQPGLFSHVSDESQAEPGHAEEHSGQSSKIHVTPSALSVTTQIFGRSAN